MLKGDPMVSRCQAKARSGLQCAHHPMAGQRVCHMHGGKSPQALAKAEDRLRALVHPAISGLAELINKADSDSVRLSAIRDLLDRTGYRVTDAQADPSAQSMRVTIAFDHAEHANGTSTLSLPDAS